MAVDDLTVLTWYASSESAFRAASSLSHHHSHSHSHRTFSYSRRLPLHIKSSFLLRSFSVIQETNATLSTLTKIAPFGTDDSK